MSMKTIHAPDGVSLLMEDLRLRHITGMSQRSDNVFMVELPAQTEEEIETVHSKDET